MDEADVNEINLTDNDARTVKFGAHQGTDVGYNVQAVVDCKNKLITTFEIIDASSQNPSTNNPTDISSYQHDLHS